MINLDVQMTRRSNKLTDPRAQIQKVDNPKLATELQKVIVTDKFRSPKIFHYISNRISMMFTEMILIGPVVVCTYFVWKLHLEFSHLSHPSF